MTAYPQVVKRWPWTLGASVRTIRFADTATGLTTSDQSIAAGNYITKGENASGVYTDFVAGLQDAASAAAVAINGIGSSVTVTLDTDGHTVWIMAVGASIDILWTDAATTLDPPLAGFPGTSDETIPTIAPALTSDYQVKHTWYPGAPGSPARDTGDQKRRVVEEVETLDGQPSQAVHDTDGHYVREIEYDIVRSARIKQCRADDAAYALYAGVTQNDPNVALENALEYLASTDTTAYPALKTIFSYTTDDPSTHVQEGPYLAFIDGTFPKQRTARGVGDGTLRRDFSAETYRVGWRLWKSGP